MTIKKYILPLILAFFLLTSCERPEPIPSALRIYIDQVRFAPNEEKLYTLFHLNFKTTAFKLTWLNDDEPCFEATYPNIGFDGMDSIQTSISDMNISFPARLRCIIEVTSMGGEVIRDTSTPIRIGFLDNTPFGNAPGLLAFWPLSENFEDYTTNQNNLISVGFPMHKVMPLTNSTGTYFSNDAYLYAPHQNRLNPKKVSISALLFLDDLNDPADLHTLVSKREYGGLGTSFDFKVSKRSPSGFKISVSWSFNGADSYLESAQNYPFKEATHIVYIHDEKNIQIWINGEKHDEIASPGLLSNVNNLPLCIGTRPGVRHSLKGYLKDVGIWNRALTEAEIKNIASLYR